MTNKEYIEKAIELINKYQDVTVKLISFKEDRYSIDIKIWYRRFEPGATPLDFSLALPVDYIAKGGDDRFDGPKYASIPDHITGDNRTLLRLAYMIWVCIKNRN